VREHEQEIVLFPARQERPQAGPRRVGRSLSLPRCAGQEGDVSRQDDRGEGQGGDDRAGPQTCDEEGRDRGEEDDGVALGQHRQAEGDRPQDRLPEPPAAGGPIGGSREVISRQNGEEDGDRVEMGRVGELLEHERAPAVGQAPVLRQAEAAEQSREDEQSPQVERDQEALQHEHVDPDRCGRRRQEGRQREDRLEGGRVDGRHLPMVDALEDRPDRDGRTGQPPAPSRRRIRLRPRPEAVDLGRRVAERVQAVQDDTAIPQVAIVVDLLDRSGKEQDQSEGGRESQHHRHASIGGFSPLRIYPEGTSSAEHPRKGQGVTDPSQGEQPQHRQERPFAVSFTVLKRGAQKRDQPVDWQRPKPDDDEPSPDRIGHAAPIRRHGPHGGSVSPALA